MHANLNSNPVIKKENGFMCGMLVKLDYCNSNSLYAYGDVWEMSKGKSMSSL